MATEAISLLGLARRLVQDGIIAAEAAQTAAADARKERIPFVTHLVKGGLAAPKDIANSASEEFGVPLFDLGAFDFEAIPKELVSEKLIRAHNALPLVRRGVRLFVAVSDPTNLQGLDEIKFQTGVNTEPVLVEEDKLAQMIEQHLNREEANAFDDLGGDEDLENLETEAVDANAAPDDDESSGADETPIVRFVNKMLLDAIKTDASDIHFEPYEKSYRVRFRRDGILQEVARPPANLSVRLSARLKVMSEMDISERRIPLDGRIKMKISKSKAIDFRVNTCPTLFGEKVVLRILDPSSTKMGIDMLGYEDDQKALYLEALESPQGMILVTGPTGSSKTVSLYTGLNILNVEGRNIATAEDPVEFNFEGKFLIGPALFPAPGPGRDHGGRDTGPGNRRDCHQGGADGAHGAVHPAHELRARDAHSPAQHGRALFQHRHVSEPHHRPAPCAAPVPELQNAPGRAPGCDA